MVKVSDLKQHEIFDVLSQKQLSKLAKITEMRTYESRDHIYERGDRADHLFVVNKGTVNLREIKFGDEVGISFEVCEPGELFGAASLMKSREYSLTAVCLGDSEVMAIEADRLLEICQKEPALGYKLMFTIAQRYLDRYKCAKEQVYQMLKPPVVITALPG